MSDTSWQCPCGSGRAKRELKDARGIFCTFLCDKCEADKRLKFRGEIFEGLYQSDELIDED
jgi:hypothetical protein